MMISLTGLMDAMAVHMMHERKGNIRAKTR
jgi:hypothetical protein